MHGLSSVVLEVARYSEYSFLRKEFSLLGIARELAEFWCFERVRSCFGGVSGVVLTCGSFGGLEEVIAGGLRALILGFLFSGVLVVLISPALLPRFCPSRRRLFGSDSPGLGFCGVSEGL